MQDEDQSHATPEVLQLGTTAGQGELCDFYDLYWRVEFSDGDWEELTRRELRHGITLAAQVSSSAQEVNRPLLGHLLAPRASS